MDKLDPENAPGFLVGRIAHRLKLHIRQFLNDAGIQLTAEELTILTALAHLGSAKSMSFMAELLGRDPTTLKRQLSRLTQQGYVERSPSKDDGRVINLSITSTGRGVVEITIPMSCALRETAMAGISEADKEVLVRCLRQMLNNLTIHSSKTKIARMGDE